MKPSLQKDDSGAFISGYRYNRGYGGNYTIDFLLKLYPANAHIIYAKQEAWKIFNIKNESKITSREKAQELFADFRFMLSLPDVPPMGDVKDTLAKQFASVVAEDNIQSHSLRADMFKQAEIAYWRGVKREIEKL